MNAECEPIHFILNKVFLPLKPTQGHTVFLYPTEVEVWSGLKNILSEMHKALSRNTVKQWWTWPDLDTVLYLSPAWAEWAHVNGLIQPTLISTKWLNVPI